MDPEHFLPEITRILNRLKKFEKQVEEGYLSKYGVELVPLTYTTVGSEDVCNVGEQLLGKTPFLFYGDNNVDSTLRMMNGDISFVADNIYDKLTMTLCTGMEGGAVVFYSYFSYPYKLTSATTTISWESGLIQNLYAVILNSPD